MLCYHIIIINIIKAGPLLSEVLVKSKLALELKTADTDNTNTN